MPPGSTYRLCLYDSVAGVPSLSFGVDIPSGGTCNGIACWKAAAGGFKFKDRLGSHGGVTGIVLKPGEIGKAKPAVRGKGSGLSLPLPVGATYLHVDTTALVQLHSSQTGKCWQCTFSPADLKRNTPVQFQAKH